MAWVAGNAEAILKVTGLAITEFNLSQVNSCMDQLEALSPTSVAAVQSILGQYTAAEVLLADLNTTGTGKTLIQADVLKWEVDKGGGYVFSPSTEMQRLAAEIGRYFNDCMGIGASSAYYGATSLIRS
jgi:hypothetical protein